MKTLHKKIGIVICVFMFVACYFGAISLLKNDIIIFTNPHIDTISKLDTKERYKSLFEKLSEDKSIVDASPIDDIFALGVPKKIKYFYNPSTKQTYKSNDNIMLKAIKQIHYHLVPSVLISPAIAAFSKPTLKAIMCIFAAGMIVCVITGIIIHRRRFADFFTIRRGKLFAYDMHILLGLGASIMLVWFSVSAISIVYSRPIITAITGEKFKKQKYKPYQITDQAVLDAKIDYELYYASGLIKDGVSISIDYKSNKISFDENKFAKSKITVPLHYTTDNASVASLGELFSKDKSYNVFSFAQEYHELKPAGSLIRYLAFVLGMVGAFCCYFGATLNRSYAKTASAICGGAIFGTLLYLLASQIFAGAVWAQIAGLFGGWALWCALAFRFASKSLIIFAALSAFIGIVRIVLYGGAGHAVIALLICSFCLEFAYLINQRFSHTKETK